MKRDYTKNLDNAITDCIANTDKTLNDVISHVFELIMSAEQSEYLGYVHNKRHDKNVDNKRNGFYKKAVQSVNATFSINIPRDRLGNFKPGILELIKDKRADLDALAFQLYMKGLTTRDIEDIFTDHFGGKYSKSGISRIATEFTDTRDKWLARPLNSDWYAIYIDALQVNIKRDTVEKEAFYIAIGIKNDLTRDVLGVWNNPTENKDGWEEVVKDIKQRGVTNVLYFAADGFSGLPTTVNKYFPKADFQSCVVHKKRNVLSKVRASDKTEVAADLNKVFVLEDPSFTITEGKNRLSEFINVWGKKYKSIKNMFPENEQHHYFTYSKYPVKMQRMIYTTNCIESLNKKIRRTIKIRGSFQNEDSAMNLICACLIEHCEDNLYKYKVTSLIDIKYELDIMLKNQKVSKIEI